MKVNKRLQILSNRPNKREMDMARYCGCIKWKNNKNLYYFIFLSASVVVPCAVVVTFSEDGKKLREVKQKIIMGRSFGEFTWKFNIFYSIYVSRILKISKFQVSFPRKIKLTIYYLCKFDLFGSKSNLSADSGNVYFPQSANVSLSGPQMEKNIKKSK